MTIADAFRPGTFVDAFRFIGEHPHLLWTKTAEHLELSGAAMGVALLIAIPLGAWLGHVHRGSFLAINVSNIGRALPSLAIIAIGLAIAIDDGWSAADGVVLTIVVIVAVTGPVVGAATARTTAQREHLIDEEEPP